MTRWHVCLVWRIPADRWSIALRDRGMTRRFAFPRHGSTHADRNTHGGPNSTLLPPEIARRTDFSFSGLKTAVMRYVREASPEGDPLPDGLVADICASFQRVAVSALLDRTFEAARWLNARSVGIAGGVSANSRLRADAETRAQQYGIPVFVPPLSLSTDNAAMIAAAGLRRFRMTGVSSLEFNAEPSLTLA